MSKGERFLYSALILVLFGIIVFFYLQLQKCKEKQGEFPGLASSSKNTGGNLHFFSFFGDTPGGKRELIHFTAYSSTQYLFFTYSTQCPLCKTALSQFIAATGANKTPGNLRVILLLTEKPGEDVIKSRITVLKISFDDWVQFGFNTPSLFYTNGKGEVISGRKGYSDDFISRVLTNRGKGN